MEGDDGNSYPCSRDPSIFPVIKWLFMMGLTFALFCIFRDNNGDINLIAIVLILAAVVMLWWTFIWILKRIYRLITGSEWVSYD
jgi:hypothetical protein